MVMGDVEHRRPPCWDFVVAAAAHGWHGLRVPSVQAPGTSLVLWRWNEAGTPIVGHIAPLGDLPRTKHPGKADGHNQGGTIGNLPTRVASTHRLVNELVLADPGSHVAPPEINGAPTPNWRNGKGDRPPQRI